MAASERVWLRPHFSLGQVNHCSALLSQVIKSPRTFNAARTLSSLWRCSTACIRSNHPLSEPATQAIWSCATTPLGNTRNTAIAPTRW